MFQRVAFFLLATCFAHLAWANQEMSKKEELAKAESVKQEVVKKDPEKTVFDLERSVAILQVSSASVDDVQILQKQIDALKQNQATSDRVDFLSNVVFLLVVVVLILIWRLWCLSKCLAQQASIDKAVHRPDSDIESKKFK